MDGWQQDKGGEQSATRCLRATKETIGTPAVVSIVFWEETFRSKEDVKQPCLQNERHAIM